MKNDIVQVVISKERYDELIKKEELADSNTFTLHLNNSAFFDSHWKTVNYPVARIERGTQHIDTFTKSDATIVSGLIFEIVSRWNLITSEKIK